MAEGIRTPQACIKCRSLKIRCTGGNNPPCVRCVRTGSDCQFVPRANAASSETSHASNACSESWRKDVMDRLKSLEDAQERVLRNGTSTTPRSDTNQTDPGAVVMRPGQPSYDDGSGWYGLSVSMNVLRRLAVNPNHRAWNDEVVRKLWSSFQGHLSGLHFLSGPVDLSRPTPLLTVAVLYLSAAQFPQLECHDYQSSYLETFSRAMEVLIRSDDSLRIPDKSTADCSFDDVLGIILVGLLAIGWSQAVGTWISVGYRILLDGASCTNETRQIEWMGLWEGLKTIELEHCSLKLAYVTLPATPPLLLTTSSMGGSPTTAAGSIGALLTIMQRNMPLFVNRGIPTIWQAVCPGDRANATVRANTHDIGVIQKWAADIDAWYQETSAQTAEASLYTRLITLLNYHLHKVYVLSIFLPLFDGLYPNAANADQLVKSARFLLEMEIAGFEIWSSWDMIVLTHAAIVILQSGGLFPPPSDTHLVNSHLEILKASWQKVPHLRQILVSSLEGALAIHSAAVFDTIQRGCQVSSPGPVSVQDVPAASIGAPTISENDLLSLFMDHSTSMDADLDDLASGNLPSASLNTFPSIFSTLFDNSTVYNPQAPS